MKSGDQVVHTLYGWRGVVVEYLGIERAHVHFDEEVESGTYPFTGHKAPACSTMMNTDFLTVTGPGEPITCDRPPYKGLPIPPGPLPVWVL